MSEIVVTPHAKKRWRQRRWVREPLDLDLVARMAWKHGSGRQLAPKSEGDAYRIYMGIKFVFRRDPSRVVLVTLYPAYPGTERKRAPTPQRVDARRAP